jgi:hypothetical protein
VKPTFKGRFFLCSDWSDMTSPMEPSKRIKSEFAESPSTADRAERVIGLLAVGISIVLGVILGFVTHELILGVACTIVVFAVIAFGSGRDAKGITQDPPPKETHIRRETPEQQSDFRGDATNPTERQTAPEGVAVRKEPKKPAEALAECERNTILSRAQSMLTTRGGIMFCARCGQALRDGVNFCEKCGAKVRENTLEAAANTEKERLCGNCGCDVTGNPKTCQWCGADLKEPKKPDEAQVRGETPEQQSDFGGDAAKPIQPQTAPEGVAVWKEPERPDEAQVVYQGEYGFPTKLQPEKPEPWCGILAALFELRRHEEVLQSFDEAIRLKPDDPEAWHNKGLRAKAGDSIQPAWEPFWQRTAYRAPSSKAKAAKTNKRRTKR